MRIFVKIIKWTGMVLAAIVLLIAVTCVYLYESADLKTPVGFHPSSVPAFVSDSLRTYGNNWLRLDKYGLWEMKISGSAFGRGEAIGKMAGDLLYYQEEVFVRQIYKLVPSRRYVRFLSKLIVIFNRHLGKYVTEEDRDEIYAMSEYCSHDFDDFGTPYERQMQYHSAHDIGHAMQDYMLVGCSSFACWGGYSADSSLIIGRNFDFYMGDDFSKNKVVLFEEPEKGYKFVSVTWPGMIGVLSGMNEKGLTVTINAAKSDIPVSSATPISILAREILQYASTIDEAYAIAGKRKTFVSESILVGSSLDGKAAIIEKSPEHMALFDPGSDHIICTNHYQSELFSSDPRNLSNIRLSDSEYRFERISQLLDSLRPVDACKAVSILRDKRGLGGIDLGYCNDLAINQLIAHHSVVFKPSERKIWVSSSPWQCGKYVCYDLNKIFSGNTDYRKPINESALTIPEDPFLHSSDYEKVLQFKRYSEIIKKASADNRLVASDSLSDFISFNPLYYGTYVVSGDYYQACGLHRKSCSLWEKALTLPMKEQEKLFLEHKIGK